MAKIVQRKHPTLFVECRECQALLECSPNDILNEGTDEWDWDTYALKGHCPKCKTVCRIEHLYPCDYFYADLVAKVGPILRD